MNVYTKHSDGEISVVETKPADELPAKIYNFAFLKAQLVSIQAQRDAYNAQRDAEIAEVETLIAEAIKLGIVDKVIVDEVKE